MSFDAIRTGSVITYPYLWAREAGQGETEGRKSRPTAVGFRLREQDGNDILVLLPITTQPPSSGRIAVEIPEIEKRRGGLDPDRRLWIIIDEFNQDVISRSYYLEPDPVIGHFSKAFFDPVMLNVIRTRRRMRAVNRRG